MNPSGFIRRITSRRCTSSNDLIYQFDYVGDPRNVVIDLTGADIWDASTVAALDAIRHKYANKGKSVEIVGLDGAGLERLDRLSGRLGEGHQLPACSPRPCGRLCVPGCFRRGGAPSSKGTPDRLRRGARP